MIEEGFKIGLGIAGAFVGLWLAGWVLFWLLVLVGNVLFGKDFK